MKNAALYTSGIIFAVGALVHLVRLITGFEWVAAGIAVPVWVHVPGLLIAIGLTGWMFVAAKKPT